MQIDTAIMQFKLAVQALLSIDKNKRMLATNPVKPVSPVDMVQVLTGPSVNNNNNVTTNANDKCNSRVSMVSASFPTGR